jgi:lycopene beta-cyclase
MTYAGFLAVGLGLPLVVLGVLTWSRQRAWPFGRLAATALLAHVVIAVAYTTPWDNYLVATGVWWYDPARVLGLTLGWVPLEEYLFFVLQPLLAGLLLFSLARRLPPHAGAAAPAMRWGASLAAAVLWLGSVVLLASGWRPGTYLGLTLAWALPPIALQLAFGADVLWRYRRSVLLTLALVTLYLTAADFIAIGAGVWTIDPAQSLQVLAGGVLPVEEITFFLVTNTLLVFGLTLTTAPETRARLVRLSRSLRKGQPMAKNTWAQE